MSRMPFYVSLQNALAATAAPFQGQYGGFEAYPYAAATGRLIEFAVVIDDYW